MNTLLLHSCCAPCALMPHKYLSKDYDVSFFFYNPNIHPQEEFEKRRDTFLDFMEKDGHNFFSENNYKGFDVWANNMPTFDFPIRCSSCYTPRLEATAKLAKEKGFNAFSTSLLYSRYQQQEVIIKQGHELAEKYDISFVDTDFRPYWYEGIKLSKEKNFYRQKYCGCGLKEQS